MSYRRQAEWTPTPTKIKNQDQSCEIQALAVPVSLIQSKAATSILLQMEPRHVHVVCTQLQCFQVFWCREESTLFKIWGYWRQMLRATLLRIMMDVTVWGFGKQMQLNWNRIAKIFPYTKWNSQGNNSLQIPSLGWWKDFKMQFGKRRIPRWHTKLNTDVKITAA